MSSTHSLFPEVDPFQEKSAFKRWMEKVGQLRPVSWFMAHVATHIDLLLMRLSGGRLNLTGADAVVVLHHVGANGRRPSSTSPMDPT